MDAWAPCAALLWSALSLADAASGTGGGLPTRLPWGVRAASSAGTRVHPVALYSAAAALALCGTLFALLRRMRQPGRVAAIALIASGTILFLLDMLRVPDQPQAQPLSHNLLDMSQWIALAAIVFGACLLALTPRARSTGGSLMPSKNMLPKGKRRQSVRAEYRKIRTELNDAREREKELQRSRASIAEHRRPLRRCGTPQS